MNILITPQKITSHKKLKFIIHKEEEYIEMSNKNLAYLVWTNHISRPSMCSQGHTRAT